MSAEITDIIRLEQYMDFLRNRTFRQTLLVKSDVEIKRKVVGANLESLRISALLTPEVADTGVPDTKVGADAPDVPDVPGVPGVPFDDLTVVGFKSSGGQGLQTGSAITKAALACLAEAYPRALAFAELVHAARQRLSAARRSRVSERQDRERLSSDLLVAYTMPGLIQLHAWQAPIAGAAEEKPATTPYIRWQAGRGAELTSLLHETVRVDEPSRLILLELDGTRSKAELVQALHGMMLDGRVKVEEDGRSVMMAADDPRLSELLDHLLAQLARLALLTGSAG
jgi:methyltransferase-like protein